MFAQFTGLYPHYIVTYMCQLTNCVLEVAHPNSVCFLTAHPGGFARHLGCLLWSYTGKKGNCYNDNL